MTQPQQLHQGPHGWLNLYKPRGISSNHYLNIVRRTFGKKVKVGHAGTLDPMADGVLPVAVGAATRLISYFQEGVKVYAFTIRWGESTDTLDKEGNVTARSTHTPSVDAVDMALPALTGHVMQLPPIYSALKKNGKRLCDLARAGEEVIPDPRPAVIHSLKRIDSDATSATFIAYVGKGVYVRAIARDICAAVGAEGHVCRLARMRYGLFFAEDAFLLADGKESLYKKRFVAQLLPIDTALDDIPAICVSKEQARFLKNGVAVRHDRADARGTKAAIYCDGHFIAIGQQNDNMIVPSKVFHTG